MDPISMIVGALAAGAASGLRDTAMGAVKDTYAGLHDMVRRRFAGRKMAETALAEYEKAPQMWAAPLSAELAAVGADTDPQIVAAAERVMALMDEAPSRSEECGPLEFDRVVPASGIMSIRRKQFWLHPHRAGLRVTCWADENLIHLSIAGAPVKTVRSHLTSADLAALATEGARPAGPPPLPPTKPGTALEVDRVVSRGGTISLANHRVLAPEILTGRRVSVRIQDATLMFFDPNNRELLHTTPNPLTWDQTRSLRGARPAGPPPVPSIEPITIQGRASNSGEITIAGQTIALGRHHASQVFTVHVSDTTVTVELARATIRTFPRTTTQTVRAIKAQRPSREDPSGSGP